MNNKIYELVLYSRDRKDKSKSTEIEHVLSFSISKEVAIKEMERFKNKFCEICKLKIELNKEYELRSDEPDKEKRNEMSSYSDELRSRIADLIPEVENIFSYAIDYFIGNYYFSKMEIREVELTNGENAEDSVFLLLLRVDNRFLNVGNTDHIILITTNNDFKASEYYRYNDAIKEISNIYCAYHVYSDRTHTSVSINQQCEEKLMELIPDLQHLQLPINQHRGEIQYVSDLIFTDYKIIKE